MNGGNLKIFSINARIIFSGLPSPPIQCSVAFSAGSLFFQLGLAEMSKMRVVLAVQKFHYV